MKFANAVKNQNKSNLARTTNGMKALNSTASSCVDLFFKIGASRGKNVIGDFNKAYSENREYALRIAQWARDARQGSGERQIFRDILNHLDKTDPEAGAALLRKTPELGRWDDMLGFTSMAMESMAMTMIKEALDKGDGLCAKWMPRKGPMAAKLRASFGWTPKYYRKRLVELTKVVEQLMCANKWEEINFNHVPSVASARYKKAFGRHAVAYEKWTEKLAAGDKDVKVNAGAVYPYDVLKGLTGSYKSTYSEANLDHIIAQWNALPNFVGDASILPIVDVSGSMESPAGGYGSKSQVSCMDVSISLGLYLADKNKGVFKDTFMNFAGTPQLHHLTGNIVEKIAKLHKEGHDWGSNTNLNKAIEKILDVATQHDVPASDMPKMILIISDMQFDQCARHDDSAIQMIARKYENAGYVMPQVVYWNLNASDNVPVEMNRKGVALVSGFSPAIVKSVLAVDLEHFTPEGIMKKTIMNARYDI